MPLPLSPLVALCAACTLLACATLDRAAPFTPLAVAPIGADEAYLMGRQHQLARSGADALRLYRQALAADPRHDKARNGMATVLAEQGDLPAAIALWQEMTAAPGADAYLFNNLGYAYFLNGQYAQAQQAQERACLLDPANPLAWQRLADTLARLGEHDRAGRMQRQAQALTAHDLHADAALAGGTALAETPPDDGWAQVELVAGVDGLLTLSRSRARAVAAALATAQSTTQSTAPSPAASLEITNGNGVTGLARATALRLRSPGLRVVRLSNESGYGVRRTRIEYQPASIDAARRLAQQIKPGAALVTAPGTVRTDLRLVLGKDATEDAT